ncbi:hypothetical protein WJX73_001484 [Symbiochloris irregularis]|uniref:Amino acid transporter transmembrane domain-containing protein n=1 Tax=Symbiochloris irregularis TaxID=706552 RepID=A0AAW1PR13_9CHLO
MKLAPPDSSSCRFLQLKCCSVEANDRLLNDTTGRACRPRVQPLGSAEAQQSFRPAFFAFVCVRIRAQLWLLPLLMLAINGGAQLLLSAAFAQTGVIAGTVFMIITAAANCWTSNKLCWQAYYTGQVDYESLSYAVGGRAWKIITEIAVFVLLYGTLVNAWVQQGQTMSAGIKFVNPDIVNSAPWLVNGNGRILMLFSMAALIPAIFMNNMSSLELLADGSFVMVIVSVVWVIVNCAQKGFPALDKHCQLPVGCVPAEDDDYDYGIGTCDSCYGTFQVSGFTTMEQIASAISVYGFIFYIQPIMMPMLPEMPPGKVGVRALSVATCVTIAGTSFIIYWCCGFFGAADFGVRAIPTGNYLSNDLGQGVAQGVLNILYIIAMLPSICPFEYCTRHAVDSFITAFMKPEHVYKTFRWRNILLATTIYLTSLGLAELFPGKTTKVIQITSAFGVLGVSYFVPIINHWLLLFGWAGVQRHRNWMRKAPISVDRVMGMTLHEVKHHSALRKQPRPMDVDSDDDMDPPNKANLDDTDPSNTFSEESLHKGAFAGDYDTSTSASARSTEPLRVKGAIKGGALDYEYRPKNLLTPWNIIDCFAIPIFILAFGFWTSIETLKLAFT